MHVSEDFFYYDRKMSSLSGGEKIKAQIIRLIMQEPTVLLLDEPSNDIDIGTLEWLEEFINGWQGLKDRNSRQSMKDMKRRYVMRNTEEYIRELSLSRK